ncbi:MAG: SUMF1/EgtB/PvdO family nonheme iron enzyme [Treponema sp.]|nr:SUMF1/EgtB/PvdO family nonheme iron enzyme [Treponema sp.]
MKTIKTISKALTLAIFCAIFFSACFSYWANSEGFIVINFGSSGRSYFYNLDPDSGDHLDFIYEVYIRRSNSSTLTKVGEFEGASGVVSVPVGRYTVILKAYEINEDGNKELRAYGYSGVEKSNEYEQKIIERTEVDVIAGQSKNVNVYLFSAVEVDHWEKLLDAVEDASPNSGNSGRKLYIFINADSLIANSVAKIEGNITLIPNRDVTIKNSEDNKRDDWPQEMFYVSPSGTLSLGEPNMSNKLTLTGTEEPGQSLIGVSTGTLEMYDGITISGNTAYNGGGVSVFDNGKFYMYGGIISGNTAHYYGGGVYVNNGTFYKYNGATIFGYEQGNPNSNKVIENGAFISKMGHAVFVSQIHGNEGEPIYRFRDDTCGPGEMLWTNANNNEKFSDNWDDGVNDGDSIKINSVDELAKIGKEVGFPLYGNYMLMDNIEISGRWEPIGTTSDRFTGTFDGNNNTITFEFVNITSTSGNERIGLFGHIDGATVKDLNLIGNLTVTFDQTLTNSPFVAVGALAGQSDNGTIHNVMTIVIINVNNNRSNTSGQYAVGGIIGSNTDNGSINDCFSEGNINIIANPNTNNSVFFYVGGIAGLSDGHISYCISESDILARNATLNIGGIAGNIHGNGIVKNCVALNNMIQVQSAGTTGINNSIGRVAGTVSNDNNINNNYARSDMIIPGINIINDKNGIHGESRNGWDPVWLAGIGFSSDWWLAMELYKDASGGNITINTQPAPVTNLFTGNSVEHSVELFIDASVTGGTASSYQLSYQWYRNTINSNNGGTRIDEAVSSNFTTLATLAVGTYYYFCEVGSANDIQSVRSNVAVVNVRFPSITSSSGIELIGIPGGTFDLGKELNPEVGGEDITPISTVNITGFYMGKYPVTQEQYVTVMGTNPSWFDGSSGKEPASGQVQGRRPVEMVSWYDAIVFCNRLSIMEGLTPAYIISGSTNPNDWEPIPADRDDLSRTVWDAVRIMPGSTGYRLLTEAQWEYAAKGGNDSHGNFTYSGSNALDTVAWHGGVFSNSGNRTHEVGKKAQNILGIYDMSGNVWEWCWDWSGDYTNDTKTDPTGAVSGEYRVMRGGSWYNQAEYVRSVYRGYYYPYNRDFGVGFRVSRP